MAISGVKARRLLMSSLGDVRFGSFRAGGNFDGLDSRSFTPGYNLSPRWGGW
ncbi:MAG: hypothetical protein ABI210_13445 [Abditibacteriaceae bacterium]